MTARSRRPRRSGWIWAVFLLTLAAACYFFGGFQRLRENRYPPNAFYQVKRGDMLISITEDGALRALNETIVRNALEGLNRILYLVPEGAYVQKGDLLVELDSSGLRDRFNEQELQHQELLFQMLQATGNLKIQKSLAESQIKDAELKVENAQSDLEKYRDGDAPLLIKTVEARTGVLLEQVRIASERHERTQELFKQGNATKSELEADALTLKREQLALDQYHEDLRLIKKYDQPNQLRLLQSNLEQARAELGRLKQRTANEIAQTEADLKTSEGALEALQEGLKTQQRRLENARIYAPQNGLVVYASVSPFQFAGEDERRRDEGRFRSRGRGGDDSGGEFRFGRRGGRSGSENNSGGSGSGGSGGASSSSVAETVAGGNQRIASAISGTPATESAGGASGGGAGGGSSSGGGRSGGGGGGQNATSPAGAFASYPSMRPSSAFGASSASNTSSAATGNASGSSASPAGQGSSGGNQFAGGNQSGGNQFGFRSSQSYRDFGFDFYGTPGFLEEGTMVRQRQELIRLPDVSKMLAEIKIAESRVGQVRAGMTAWVTVNNIPHHRFKGTVRRVALLPDSQSSWLNPNAKLFPADILVEEELPILKPGVSATAEIVITNLTNVLNVPIQTVARLGGENVCFIKTRSGVKPVPVTTGLFNDAFIEITWGLKEGDLVLLAPVGDEDIEEAPPVETNNVPPAGEFPVIEPVPGAPADSRRNNLDERSPDLPGRGEPSDSLRRGPSPGRGDSSRRGDSEFPRRGDMDPPRRSESYDPAPPGEQPPAEGRRFRRRESDATNGAPPSSERRRGRRERPQNVEEPE